MVIGLWGLLTLGPIFAKHIYPIVGNNMPDVPVLRYFRSPVGQGEGLLTAGIVLALMIIPIITATTRDLFLQVPALPKEGGEALGMTDVEVANKITLPWVRSGIIGATALGLGRALGETIAVALIAGSVLGHIAPNIYSPMSTIAATIVTQLDGAQTDGTGFAVATLAELALILAVVSVAVNLLARWIITRTSKIGAPRRAPAREVEWRAQHSPPPLRPSCLFRVATFLSLALVMVPAAWLLISVFAKAIPHLASAA